MLLFAKLSLPFVLTIVINGVSAANILVITHFISKSMHLDGTAISDILVARGHNVTLVSAYKIDGAKKFQHVHLSDVVKAFDFEAVDFSTTGGNPYKQIYDYNLIGMDIANRTYKDPNFQKLLHSKTKFDLVILETIYSESLFYVSEIFKTPLLLYSSLFPTFWSNPPVGNPAPPSHVPDLSAHSTTEMTFLERLDNTIRYLITHLLLHWLILPGHDAIVKESFPDAPDISTYYNKASMILLNSNPSVADPIPKVPGMIEIGGFHIRPPKPLPEELQTILDRAKEGVVYFSLGSNLKSSTLPRSTIEAVLNVLRKLNQTVLWKFEKENLPGKPDNVVIRKWMPQNDILAHKNVKVFVTHGGFHGMLETVFHGVPCVGLPVFVDQVMNCKRGQMYGFTEWLKLKDLTEIEFETALRKVLNNAKYKEAAMRRSKIMRDTPLSKADLLSFWVEYAIRNQGAEYLKVSSLKLSWYQYLLLDVIGFILLCVCLATILVALVVKKLLSLCTKEKNKEKTS